MRFLRLRKCHVEAIKGISKILIFLLKKCWLQFTALILVIVFVYGFYGGLLALLSGFLGAAAVVYKIGDWFLYHPEDPPDSRVNVASPSILRLPFESAFIKTADGVTINVVLVKQEPPDKFSSVPTLIYLHGNAGNIGHRLQNVSELYHYLNCNLLLVEYRGYGLSKGSPSESGLYMDSEAGLHYLLQHPAIDRSQIVLFGRSLGGAVAIELARNPALSPHISAVIVENTFTSIPDIGRILFDCKLIRLIPNWFYKNHFNNLAKISSISIPMLFLSGLQDELIPPSMMHLLYQASGSVMKHYHLFESGTHNFTWRCNEYYVIINAFMSRVTRNSLTSKLETFTETQSQKTSISLPASPSDIHLSSSPSSSQLSIPSSMSMFADQYSLRTPPPALPPPPPPPPIQEPDAVEVKII